MVYPVVTAEAARELNIQAQTVDPILFWTCNYEPTICYAISEDARFLTGIQDLYKFAIDTNCVLRDIARNGRHCICPDLLPAKESNELSDLIEIVQNLRAVIDHNQSDMNGSLFSSQTESFTSWVRSIIYKDQPTDSSDFATLNRALNAMGNALVSLSGKIIDLLKQRSDREVVVKKWIEAILQWYCNGTRSVYYKSQLTDYYVARACARRAYFYSNVKSKELNSKIDRWIKKQTTQCFDAPLKRIRKERDEIQNHLSNPSNQELKLKAKMPEMYNRVVEERKSRLAEIDTEEEKLRRELVAFERLHGRNKCAYFFEAGRLNEQLHITLRALREEGEVFTLLPQDFLQKDVERTFAGVRSPDRDF